MDLSKVKCIQKKKMTMRSQKKACAFKDVKFLYFNRLVARVVRSQFGWEMDFDWTTHENIIIEWLFIWTRVRFWAIDMHWLYCEGQTLIKNECDFFKYKWNQSNGHLFKTNIVFAVLSIVCLCNLSRLMSSLKTKQIPFAFDFIEETRKLPYYEVYWYANKYERECFLFRNYDNTQKCWKKCRVRMLHILRRIINRCHLSNWRNLRESCYDWSKNIFSIIPSKDTFFLSHWLVL